MTGRLKRSSLRRISALRLLAVVIAYMSAVTIVVTELLKCFGRRLLHSRRLQRNTSIDVNRFYAFS
jgi:hypothetical protein